MNSNLLNKIVIAAVAVALIVVAVIIWRVSGRSRYEVPSTPPPVPAAMPAADRARLEEQFRKLYESLEAYGKAQAERDQHLEQAIAAARANGEAEEESRLRQVQEEQRERWAEYDRRFREWDERMRESSGPEPRVITAPPLPPPQGEPQGTPDDGELDGENGTGEPAAEGDAALDAIGGMIGAAVCIAQPELCPVVEIALEIFKNLFGGDRETVLRLAEAFALGQGVPPDVVEAAGKILREDPEARDAILDIIRKRAEIEGGLSPELQAAEERLGAILSGAPLASGLYGEVIGQLRKGVPCDEVCELIRERWDRALEPEREALRTLVRQAPEGGGCLESCLAGLLEEAP